MSARIAIPLAVIIALAALVAGVITGVAFLIVFAVVGLIAAAAGAIWAGRKASTVGTDSDSAAEPGPPTTSR